MEYKIDAKGKKLGRLASEIATLLMGKNSLDFEKHKVADVKVVVSGASGLDISAKKMEDKRYKSFSGYPSGLKVKSAKEIVKVHGYGELIRNAVKGMLPGNKLRSRLLKNIEITE
ncbi:MAG TPA: 50S ribosomal protein L13 [Candidatus Paceibacterota bacterium]|jgi:large subunit ribosomal protein L13|nr:50S ribosomal protein L13 [Parcubacteria group bacterium]MDP6119678.1 50S ribosomal protein L13 [Candidatus Paceibacterota bacterium]HJN62776.1 50S ribosomal protein L13 [Candidatus Paceibacterota bacterium]|tara:strand:+ start:218 stop:562 length:345 start_codon:yes stop_codon:yes gene_type:complete